MNTAISADICEVLVVNEINLTPGDERLLQIWDGGSQGD